MSVRERVGGLCWLCVFVYFVAQPVTAAAWTSPYSWSKNFISDLGRQVCTGDLCSPRHSVMNAALVLTGLLIVVGVALLWPTVALSPSSTFGLALVAVGGIGTVVVGLVPTDVVPLVHSVAAALHIPLQAVGIVLVGVGSRRVRPVFALVTFVAGTVAVVGVVVFFTGVWAGSAVGAGERLADYPFYLGLVGAGLVVVLHPSDVHVPSAKPE